MDNLTNPTPDAGGTATAETSPVTDNGTVQPNSEANGQGAPVEEGFTHVDPKTLPPQLRSAYDNMLRDYKEKTSKLSETVKTEAQKAAEAYKKRAEMYDQISSQEEFVRQWNEYVQKQSQPGEPEDKTTQLEKKLQEITTEIQMSKMSQITDAFASAVNEKGEKIHGDFDELNSIVIGQLNNGAEKDEYSLLRACIELAPGATPQERLANGYSMAKNTYTSIFEAGKKAGMGRLQTKAQNSSLSPSSSNDAITITDKKPKSAREAIEMARKGIMVSRD